MTTKGYVWLKKIKYVVIRTNECGSLMMKGLITRVTIWHFLFWWERNDYHAHVTPPREKKLEDCIRLFELLSQISTPSLWSHIHRKTQIKKIARFLDKSIWWFKTDRTHLGTTEYFLPSCHANVYSQILS